MVKDVKIMSPAGDFVMLKAAIDAGADSVYFGVDKLNMRVSAKNFTIKDMKQITRVCHDKKVKAYLTLNSVIYDNELLMSKKIISAAKKACVDGVICHDVSIIVECKKQKIPIIISTQASISNVDAVKYYVKLGAKRVVLARELSLEQVRIISNQLKKEKIKVELEVFIHGAMCVSVSGRCFISQFQYGRSANRGDCLQPCRRSYKVTDLETGDELEVGNNYVLSPKDLCTIGFLDKIIDSGVTCLKIEGRARSPEYVYTTTKAYKTALNAIKKGVYTKKLVEELTYELEKVYNRGFSNGFYFGKPINEWTKDYGGSHKQKKEYVGRVINYYPNVCVAEIKVESNILKKGDKVMFQGPTTGVFEQVASSLQIDKKDVLKAIKGRGVALKTDKKVRTNDKVYVVVDTNL